MKKTIWIITLVITVAVIIISCSNNHEKAADHTRIISNDSLIQRGSYLVTIMGCDDCHSPKRMGAHGPELDMSNRLSGHPAQIPLGPVNAAALKSWVLFNPVSTATVGPWGASFASNLTPSQTGIGNWTEAQFFKALREGKVKGLDGGRTLLPPMPWQNIGKASDDDIRAIFAYLKSITAVDNLVPAPIAPYQLDSLAK